MGDHLVLEQNMSLDTCISHSVSCCSVCANARLLHFSQALVLLFCIKLKLFLQISAFPWKSVLKHNRWFQKKRSRVIKKHVQYNNTFCIDERRWWGKGSVNQESRGDLIRTRFGLTGTCGLVGSYVSAQPGQRPLSTWKPSGKCQWGCLITNNLCCPVFKDPHL